MSIVSTIRLAIVTALSFTTYQAQSVDFAPAKLLENNNSKYYKTKLKTRQEYWSYSNYIINDTGLPSDILVLDATSVEKSDLAHKYINNLEFTPAKLNNQAVTSNNFFVYNKNKAFANRTNDAFSSQFEKQYLHINTLIDSNKLINVEVLLSELFQSETKNLTEQALHAWLASYYFYKTQNEAQYLNYISKAYKLKNQVPTKVAYRISMSFLKYKLHTHAYKEAIDILSEIRKIKGLKIDAKSLDKTFNEVITMARNTPEFTLEKTLSKFGNTHHTLSRTIISVQTDNGTSKAELRCNNGRHIFEKSSFKYYKVPENLKECTLFLIGQPNSTAKITEQGNLNFL